MTYKPNDRVYRIQEFMPTGATVVSFIETIEGQSLQLRYDEGGEGWWPADSVTVVASKSG